MNNKHQFQQKVLQASRHVTYMKQHTQMQRTKIWVLSRDIGNSVLWLSAGFSYQIPPTMSTTSITTTMGFLSAVTYQLSQQKLSK